MSRLPLILALTLAAAFALYFSWFDIGRHNKTNSTRFDLGNVEQVEWNLINGRGFTMTDPYGTATVSRFAFHADPFLIILAPFYAVFPRTETLLLLQVLFVASGAVALFLLGRKLVDPWSGLVLTLLYVINPALQWSTIFDVHAVTFAVPLILWAAYAAVKKKYWLTMIFVVLAMTTKEQIGLSLPLIGLYVLMKQKQLRWGIVLIAVPVLWSLLMFFVVLPTVNGASSSNGEVYRSVFGTGAAQVVSGAMKDPVTAAKQLMSGQNIRVLWQLSASVGFLPLGSWCTLGAAPDYIINAFSLKPAQHLLVSHYSSGMTPWLFIGSTLTLQWIKRRLNTIKKDSRRWGWCTLLTVWLIGWGIYAAWAFGPLPGARNDWSRFVTWRNEYATPVAKWEKLIPTGAAVSVTNNIGSHFARREHFYSFPHGVEQADYIVVLEGHATPVVATQTEVTEAVFQLQQDTDWRILEKQGELTVLKRK